jgi:glycine hydroxymethyltransferase
VSNAPKTVIEAMGSAYCNNYSEGYPGFKYYGGNENAEEVETDAIEFSKKIFDVPYSNVQPYSGSIANFAVYNTLFPKNTINKKFMGLDLPHGGHLTHGGSVNIASKYLTPILYGVDKDTGFINMKQVRSLAQEHKPNVIWCGTTAYSRKIPYKEFGEIADECGAYLVADISHVAGLIATKFHPNPSPYAHIITTTTQKSLRGPKGSIIMTTRKGIEKDTNLAKKIDHAVFPNLQGGPSGNNIFGISVALQNSLTPEFGEYIHDVVKNAHFLSNFLQESGIKILTDGTDNHQMLLDFSNFGIGLGFFIQLSLEHCGIIVNKNTIPWDLSSPVYPSGIRIGTLSITSRGASSESDMCQLSGIITKIFFITVKMVDEIPVMKDWPFGSDEKKKRSEVLKLFKYKLAHSPPEELSSLSKDVDFFIKNILTKDI